MVWLTIELLQDRERLKQIHIQASAKDNDNQ